MRWNQQPEKIAELVHQKSVEILTEVGFCAPEESLLLQLSKAGFIVNNETKMIRITQELLDTALKTLPKNVKLFNRGGSKGLDFNDGSKFMGAGTPVNVLDLENGKRRNATHQDVCNLITIQDALPQVDIVRPTVTATDLGDHSDLVEIAELVRRTEKPIVHRTLSPERVEAAVELLAAARGGEDALRFQPNFATLYCPISPGYYTKENIQCMLKWAEYGIPITLLSMAMGGASAPVTLLGELVVINTDILAWIVVLQILFPGSKLLYGSVSSVLDMRTGILPLGAPERGMVNSGAAIMGRYYGIPSMCGGLSSDAKELDVQAGFEKSVTAVPLLLEGAGIIYGVGSTDAGSEISYSQMIMDAEFIGGLRRMMQGISIHDLSEEVELIKANTPRGNFLKAKHTKTNYTQHWKPEILNKDAYETWLEKGTSLERKSREKAQQILKEHKHTPLPAGVEAELERIIRRFIGSDFGFDPIK
ncbi:MAG TPA: trimethylamine methyltransferase family protein [Anaerolineales bacterium]|nr:trimethylamine methyltransferase family protein [Anaerolineales bacterium]